MRMRQCKRCGGNAIALQVPKIGPFCMDCIDRDGPDAEYICSVAGCGDRPTILAILNGDGTAVLLCERHFKENGRSVSSFMDLPPWLSEGIPFMNGDGEVVVQIDLG